MSGRLPAALRGTGQPGPISIVRATRQHAADAVRLIEEYQDAVGVIVRDTPDEIQAFLDRDGKAIWLAYAADEPVGCIALRPIPLPGRAGELKRLYVQPSHRGGGIARQLVEAVERYAAASGYTDLYLDSKSDLTTAIRFYERLGYAHCDRYNDNPQATVFMHKPIAAAILIRPFEPSDAEAFRLLNEAWITKLFQLEPADRIVLNDPIGQIIQTGGSIYMAVRGDARTACCALINMEDADGSFELSKMAVDEKERGKGVGRLLLEHVVEQARTLRIRRLYLETNSSLHNAIHLYEAIGFHHLPRRGSHYARGDVAMELLLQP